ncbi:phosphate ABC transporter permease subunit PstC [uncultured Fusobacterium sp.]|uniref:phosphate ABC transporter permease subunit PstC n=1 Tax=uncultured Fusobacterium sp. TaxID=159267 RepID=UPI0025EB9566|nr:phosphate ABC transporter permease subunit PstC [uncultured Fusobacterium sp.]
MQGIRKIKDSGMKHLLFGIGISNIIIIFLIFLFILLNGIKFFDSYAISDFLFGKKWISLSEIYGLLPLLVGSFWVVIVALLIAVPMGILTAIYIAEYASPKLKTVLKIIIETMSAIPSVVLGFIGLYVLSGPVKELFNLTTGLTALTGGIMLAFMAIPTIVSIADDSLEALDKSYKEASLALGANHLETIFNVLLPAAFPGIFAGIMLGFGRIIGETLTVLMITGNSPILASSPLSAVRTLTATIAAEMGEVVQGSTHYYALFAIGIVLFFISFITNCIADRFIRKAREL